MNWATAEGQLVTPDKYQHFADSATWDDGGSFVYGRWTADKNGKWFVPKYTGGSDYSDSCLVEVSNYEVLREEAEKATVEGQPAFYVTFHGGHGTFAIAFHIERTPQEIQEMLASLANYPLLDDNHHSNLERTLSEEAWNNTYRRDYARALEKRFNGECDDGPLSDKFLERHFYYWMDEANVYWENDGASIMHIDVDRIAKAALGPPKGFRKDK